MPPLWIKADSSCSVIRALVRLSCGLIRWEIDAEPGHHLVFNGINCALAFLIVFGPNTKVVVSETILS